MSRLLTLIAAWVALSAVVIGVTAYIVRRRHRQEDEEAQMHEQRLAIYTEFLAAGMEMFAAKVLWLQKFGNRPPESLREEETLKYCQRPSRRRLSEAVRRLRAAGKPPVVLAAQRMFIAAITLDEAALRAIPLERLIQSAQKHRRVFEATVQRELRAHGLPTQ